MKTDAHVPGARRQYDIAGCEMGWDGTSVMSDYCEAEGANTCTAV